jgi:hypothetical protein
MLDSLNAHTFLEALGLLALVAVVVTPFYAAVWEISRGRTIRRLAAEKERQ